MLPFTHTHYMGKLNVVLPDDVENRFRKVVFEKMGRLIGNVSEALEEAIEDWMRDNKEV